MPKSRGTLACTLQATCIFYGQYSLCGSYRKFHFPGTTNSVDIPWWEDLVKDIPKTIGG